MTYRDRQRLADIQAAIEAIRSHLLRGDLSDGLIFDAVRIRLLEIGEAVKALPKDLLDTQPAIPWREITRMRDHLAHRYFDTAHAILQATVDDDLPELEHAVRAMVETLPEEDQPVQDDSGEGAPSEEELPS
ncbi:MAG TPA: HepT-like ribonuclease domain-containing protein [Streptosporangiaceae bacterium]|nr:HepT-like ribonuclease domain-containing protein [Streptosporangiaceae bacterium]